MQRFASLLLGVTSCLSLSACEDERVRQRHFEGPEHAFCYSDRDCPFHRFCSRDGECVTDHDHGDAGAGNTGTCATESAGAAGENEVSSGGSSATGTGGSSSGGSSAASSAGSSASSSSGSAGSSGGSTGTGSAGSASGGGGSMSTGNAGSGGSGGGSVSTGVAQAPRGHPAAGRMHEQHRLAPLETAARLACASRHRPLLRNVITTATAARPVVASMARASPRAPAMQIVAPATNAPRASASRIRCRVVSASTTVTVRKRARFA